MFAGESTGRESSSCLTSCNSNFINSYQSDRRLIRCSGEVVLAENFLSDLVRQVAAVVVKVEVALDKSICMLTR